jgi:sRNA-binding regulator protein Hfq
MTSNKRKAIYLAATGFQLNGVVASLEETILLEQTLDP